MDNITHTLVGLMLSRAGLDRGEKGTPLMIMLAANAPDMDTYNFFIDNLEYLQARKIEAHIKRMKSRKFIENLKKYPEIQERLIKLYP